MTLIVCTGGRDFRNAGTVDRALSWWRRAAYEGESRLVVVVGDARGLDAMVREWCELHDVNYLLGRALWNGRLRKRAGFERNAAMLMVNPDALVAFPGGNGTAHCVGLARSSGIPIFEASNMAEWESH